MDAIVGWLTLMGMVFGGVGIVFFSLSVIRASVIAVRSLRKSAQSNQTETEYIFNQ